MNSSPTITSSPTKNFKNKKSHVFIKQVKDLFRRMDLAIEAFRRKSSLSCLAGCGHCCWNPKVETTVLEMLPLAERLIESGQADLWYEKAKAVDFAGVCVFYDHHPDNPDKGWCSIYEYRPSICRLYGFSGMVNKRGGINLMTCSVIKQKDSDFVRAAQGRINQGMKVPIMKEFSAKLYQVDSVLGHQRWPINKAMAMAVERLGLQQKYDHSETKNENVKGGD